MADDYIPPLVHLPGTRLTPEVVLHRTMNKMRRIKAVTIVIQWDDDTMSVDWSQQKASELCMAALMLTDTAGKVAIRREPVDYTEPA